MDKSEKKNTNLPAQVIALYDHDPLNDEVQHEDITDSTTPAISMQLDFERGEQFEVVDSKLDWWLLCKSQRSGKEGYVPTVYLAPLYLKNRYVIFCHCDCV